MATREENLKKINDELEKLDDEQLDKVAGGIIRDIGIFDAPSNLDIIENPQGGLEEFPKYSIRKIR